MTAERPILVAGGGPVGFITALALARQGLPVHLFEAEARINDMPRAATTHAATLEMLAGLGQFARVRQDFAETIRAPGASPERGVLEQSPLNAFVRRMGARLPMIDQER